MNKSIVIGESMKIFYDILFSWVSCVKRIIKAEHKQFLLALVRLINICCVHAFWQNVTDAIFTYLSVNENDGFEYKYMWILMAIKLNT